MSFPDHVDIKTGNLDQEHWTDYKQISYNCVTDRVRLNLVSVYPTYDGSHDAGLSEVRLYAVCRWDCKRFN